MGARRFRIVGHLRSDRRHSNLPDKIGLVSIDGNYIDKMSNYESFEELLVEIRFRSKTIQAIDLSNNKWVTFNQPKGYEYYDFEPQFLYVE